MLKLFFQWEKIDTTSNILGNILVQINIVLFTVFACLYMYQNIYILIAIFFKSKKFKEAKKQHKYAYIIAARNEEKVIGFLIDSILKQDYPEKLMQIFVVADNCTDNTASVARSKGAICYERFDDTKIGKSYALDFIFKKLIETNYDCDACFVFDADNLLTSNYTTEVNKAYDSGYKVLTTYRNSKNYGKNILTSGSGLCYLRECVLLHKVRTKLNLSTYVSGTGFLVDFEIIKKQNGWVHHLLIEDLEFSTAQMLNGYKIGYVHNAIFYDEQPVRFKDSWNQRLRWVKGAYQCFNRYIISILKTMFSFKFKKTINRFSLYEMGLFFAPIPALSILWLMVYNGISVVNYLLGNITSSYLLSTSVKATYDFFKVMFPYGILVASILTITQWKRLHTTWYKKIFYIFAFPFFMLTYSPLVLIAPFVKVKWKVIPHTFEVDIKDVEKKV